jgi:hypothetical protein
VKKTGLPTCTDYYKKKSPMKAIAGDMQQFASADSTEIFANFEIPREPALVTARREFGEPKKSTTRGKKSARKRK